MRRLMAISATALLLLCLAVASVAAARTPSWTGSASIDPNNLNLVVSFTETGLEGQQKKGPVTYTLTTGDNMVEWNCGPLRGATNWAGWTLGWSQPTTYMPDKQGMVSGTLTSLSASPDERGWPECLAYGVTRTYIKYTDVAAN